ncbi:MAG TPA: hypothetical protein VM055_00890 [Novosphingobium sp.]|nr:hypothetical protein [Novosphingobium sp.]
MVASAPVAAGPWVDSVGRSTELTFPGSAPVKLTAGTHSLTDGVAAFVGLCVETGFDRAKVERAAAASDWAFAYRAEMMPFKPPVDVGGWNAADATLRMANGIFFNKKPQCSFMFAPQGGADMAAVQAALTKLIGPPGNAAKQFDKNGKAKKYYTPEWTVTVADAKPLKVYALPAVYNAGAFQLAVLQN